MPGRAAAILEALPLAGAEWEARRVAAGPTVPAAWTPLPGPQAEALASSADETLYGGQAGGGKTDLLLGLALVGHTKSVIFRREYRQLADIERRAKQLIEDGARYNGTKLLWAFPDGRSLELGASQHEDDVRAWRGRPHDLKAFDELSEFTESQYLFLSGWARTTVPGQRVRIVGATNPPSGPEGEWVIRRWAPWLDPTHPDPAAPGELRWFARIDGTDREVEDAAPFEHKGETVHPRSRTFIPAALSDNPYLSADPAYRATLQALPEPLRSQLLLGLFVTAAGDDPRSAIPASWVREAQRRWSPRAEGHPWTCVGVDAARGGRDRMVVAGRVGDWFAPLHVTPGADVPDGEAAAAVLAPILAAGGYANVDVIGIGSSVYDVARLSRLAVWPVNVSRAAVYPDGRPVTDRSGRLQFKNVRAAMYWLLREALDPALGSTLELPPSRTLAADLSAPRWSVLGGRVGLESKDDAKDRLGRSPDEGDAVALAWWTDPAIVQQHRPPTVRPMAMR